MSHHKHFVCDSLNTHLFFARIMKEHAIFLEADFVRKDSKLAKIAYDFNCKFNDILLDAICLADGHIDDRAIKSNEICTEFTCAAEEMTCQLTGIKVHEKTTILEKEIHPTYNDPNSFIVEKVHHLNEITCDVLKKYICFKQNILDEVCGGHLFTFSYPSLLDHLIEEAKHYLADIKAIECNIKQDLEDETYEHEIFWSEIMCEHMEFIQGLLDHEERKLRKSAHHIYEDLEKIRHKIEDNPYNHYTDQLICEIKEVKKFKTTATEGILKHEISSVMIPLMADHVLREANHFIRILKEYEDKY